MNPDVAPGIYKHWKGEIYEVLFTALDVDSNEVVVVYRRGHEYYTRPISEWFDLKDNTYRFIRIDKDEL